MSISTPAQITVPFATSGLKNAIPASSDLVNGKAGYDQGFPPINMTPKTAGGIPPFGQDFNGIFYDLTTAIRYLEAGGSFPYSSAFSTAVGGYPLGAIVSRTDGTGVWRNTVANNTTDPETFGAGWQPEGSGSTTVPMTNANVTLTALQGARSIIIITGTLTASLQLIFPTYQRQWLVVNNATGAFSVTCKTSAGSGVSIATGLTQSIYGDGTNIYSSSATQTQQSIVGAYSNLKAGALGASSSISVTVDEISLEASAGSYLTVRAVSLTVNSAGSGANGLDAGTIAASTWYSLWVISNGTTTAGLISTSQTSPTMPSGYTYKARIGWIRTDGTANKYPLAFQQRGDEVTYTQIPGSNVTQAIIMASGSQGVPATPTYVAIPIGNYVPATASHILAGVMGYTGNSLAYLSPNNSYGAYNNNTNMPYAGAVSGSAEAGWGTPVTMMLESSNIYWTSNAGVLVVRGWRDSL